MANFHSVFLQNVCTKLIRKGNLLFFLFLMINLADNSDQKLVDLSKLYVSCPRPVCVQGPQISCPRATISLSKDRLCPRPENYLGLDGLRSMTKMSVSKAYCVQGLCPRTVYSMPVKKCRNIADGVTNWYNPRTHLCSRVVIF